jgi:hypothetical protein
LFTEHCQERRKERDGETREEDSLNLDDPVGRAGPLWESGDVASEGGVVNLVDENTKEGGSLIVWIGFELRVYLDDEGRGDYGEQTGLYN